MCIIALLAPTTALAWSPLRSENSDVNKGNALMSEGQPEAALESYDLAAEELPDSKGVQLNRGLALLAQDLIEQAKEPLLAAADPSAPTNTRADAYYDLGVAYARNGDALAQQQDHEQATASFREAADAFKRSLRLRPGDRDGAWNLEYALQRIREQEQKQQEQEQQEQGQEEGEEQEENQNPGEEPGEEQEPGQEEQQEQGQGEEQEQEQQSGQGEEEGQEQDQEQGKGQSQDPGEDEQEGNEQTQETREQSMQRDDVQRFLDALEQNEESLPLERARRESAGRRPPEKDW